VIDVSCYPLLLWLTALCDHLCMIVNSWRRGYKHCMELLHKDLPASRRFRRACNWAALDVFSKDFLILPRQSGVRAHPPFYTLASA